VHAAEPGAGCLRLLNVAQVTKHVVGFEAHMPTRHFRHRRNIIPGSGGVRKICWGVSDRGKCGGVRMIYYWAVKPERLLMLMIYAKNDRTDLTAERLNVLGQIVG
jgi:hypothetical protein